MRPCVVIVMIVLTAALCAGIVGAQVPTLTTDVRWTATPEPEQTPVDLSQRRSIAIPQLTTAPEIDARLDDAAWQEAASADEWMVNTGERPAPVQTTAWLGTHQGILYVGIRAQEPNVEGIVASVEEDGGPTWNDDCVELFVDANLDLESARQLIINALGTVTTAMAPRGEWEAKVTRAARVGDDAWFAELAMPMSDVGLTGTNFGLNICRERRAGGGDDVELSCWSPTGGGFHQPDRFGLASLPGGYLQAFCAGRGLLGHNELTVTLKNPDDEARNVRARLTWWQGEGMALERTLGPFALEPGATREVTFDYDIATADEPVQMEVAVLDADGDVLAARRLTQKVQDVLDMQASRCVLRPGEREMIIRGALHVQRDLLERSQVVLAVFARPEMGLVAREELLPQARAMRADIRLPELSPGTYSVHLVLKRTDRDEPRRVAEEKVLLHLLEPVAAR